MKQIVVKCGKSIIGPWVDNIAKLLPEFQVLPHTSPELRQEEVHYLVGWQPDALWANSFPNLKALVSIGSGVDHIQNLPRLRADIPVLRTVAPALAQKMKEFVLMCTLAWQRQLLPALDANRERKWIMLDAPIASELTVGIMGYGQMGRAVADALSTLGYQVKLWSKSAHEGAPYPYYSGKEALCVFATGCDVLVCLLPLTQQTAGILQYDLFRAMNKGGCLINAARGDHLIEQDLFRALNEKLLSYAFLDVFSQEPLPVDSPMWGRKDIVVTYHCAASINVEIGAQVAAANIRAYDGGHYTGPRYDPALGY